MSRRGPEISKDQYQEAQLILENGGTKKAACEALGIAYNTKRLDKLMDEHFRRQEVDKTMRAKKRKTAVSDSEVASWITDYLNGAGFEELSSSYYRSANVIRYHLEKHGALLRQPKVEKLKPAELPEQCIAEDFEIGQYVWSAAYNCMAQVVGKYKDAFRIQVLGNGVQEYSYQPAYELGNLQHLEKLGVNLASFTEYMKGDEVKMAIYETMLKANKNARKASKDT